ncbi:hypothetical protein [Streptomyces sp. NPDC006925]|uniref:hypothetical protein n=1 Tax=Streptomyces sp. NPDC006925 TaxID=3364768 RepID=UPI0036C8515D
MPLCRSRAVLPLNSTLLCLLCLLCLLTGCAGEPHPGPDPEAAAGGPAAASVPPPGEEARAISVPLDRYDPSPAEQEVLDAAEDLLTARCMRRRGLSWERLPRTAAQDAEPRNRRRYGVVEPEIARGYGYHLPPDRPGVARRAAAAAARRAGLGDAGKTAAYGPEGRPGKATGGCVKQAEDALLDDVPDADFALLDDTIGTTYERSMKARSVARVFRAWSACMRQSGYRYADPMQALSDERWLRGDRASAAEIRQARTDVRCKKGTDLVAVWNAAENRIQRAAIGEHPAAFAKLLRAQRAWMAAARRVLEGS